MMRQAENILQLLKDTATMLSSYVNFILITKLIKIKLTYVIIITKLIKIKLTYVIILIKLINNYAWRFSCSFA